MTLPPETLNVTFTTGEISWTGKARLTHVVDDRGLMVYDVEVTADQLPLLLRSGVPKTHITVDVLPAMSTLRFQLALG